MKLTRKNLRNIILQEMSDWASHNRRNQQFTSAQRAYDSMTPADDERDPPSADATDEEIFETLLDEDYLDSFVEYAIDMGVFLTLSESTGFLTDSNGNVVARFVDTGEVTQYGPKQNFEIIDEAGLISAVKLHFMQFDLATFYADEYDDIIIQQYNNDY